MYGARSVKGELAEIRSSGRFREFGPGVSNANRRDAFSPTAGESQCKAYAARACDGRQRRKLHTRMVSRLLVALYDSLTAATTSPTPPRYRAQIKLLGTRARLYNIGICSG